LQRRRETSQRIAVRLGEFVLYDEMACLAGMKAMGKGTPAQVRIDEGGDRADLQETKPGDYVFRAILHQQRNAIAAPDSLRSRPMSDAVGTAYKIAVGKRLVSVDDGRLVGRPLRPILDNVDDGARGVRLDLAHAPEGARKACDINGFARNGFGEGHSRIASP